MGQNPVVGSANSGLERKALRNLDWLVVRDSERDRDRLVLVRHAENESGEVRPQDIGTEVFFLPAAAHTEKDGTFTNTQRLLQWHHKAVEPPRRLPLGAVVRLPPRAPHPRAARGVDAPTRPAAAST